MTTLARRCILSAAALVATASVCWGAPAAADPSTYVYDAPAAARKPFPTRMPDETRGWTRVPGDDRAHAFAGRAVLLNHAVRVVLARGGRGAALYARTGEGFRRRAVLVPRPSATSEIPACTDLRLRENTRGAVAVAAAFRYESGATARAVFRLTAGAHSVEIRAAEGTARVAVQADASHVIVPDFFAGDILFSADATPRAAAGMPVRDRLAVPAENCLLAHAGEALLMAVWRSGAQQADLVFARATAGKPGIAGFEVECAADRPVWVASLEAPRICERLRVAAGETAAETVAAWTPPFPATWRAGRLAADAAADTWDLAAAAPPAWAKRPGAGGVLVYPIDRSRETPLTVLCPVDVLRDVLGMGPCRYILDAEGLGGDGGPTPAEVTPWVERQFSRRRDGRRAEQITERLAAMRDHLARTAARIRQYARWAERMRGLVPADGKAAAGPAEGMIRILDDLRQDLADGENALKAPALAEPMVEQIEGLIGRDGAAAEVQRLGGRLRDLGASQDRTLARCRMAARRLEASARMAADTPDLADLAAAVRAQAETMLRGKETPP
ncbi:MAG: hypothetical protein R6X20_14030 [Phycisphaerae bacterium]